MTRLWEMTGCWLGLCRKAPSLRTAPAAFMVPPATMNPAEPGGGGSAGGASRIRNGIGITEGSVKTLAREKHLLWFSALAGLVIAFMFLAEYLLNVLESYPYGIISEPAGIVLTFMILLVSLFCFCLLLAGLVLSQSLANGEESHPVRRGLSEAEKFLRPLLAWSGIMAVAGAGIYFLLHSAWDLTIHSFITRFPFGYIVTPETYGQGPIAGGFHIMYASDATFLMMLIIMVMFAVTAFIVPAVVLEKKSLFGAVRESGRCIRRSWAEILVCFFLLGISLAAFTALSGLFQMVFSAVQLNSPFWYEFYYKGGWRAVAALYMTAWLALALIGATIGGIAIKNLYSYARTARIPEDSSREWI